MNSRFCAFQCLLLLTLVASSAAPNLAIAEVDLQFQRSDQLPMILPNGELRVGPESGAAKAAQAQRVQGDYKSGANSVVDERWGDAFGVPLGCDARVWASVVAPTGEIYLGGEFYGCAGKAFNHVVRYDPTSDSWTGLGLPSSNGVNGSVYSLALDGSTLYVGGNFSEAYHGSTLPVSNVALFDLPTQQWSPMGSGAGNGVDQEVWALAADENHRVYVGGFFVEANVGDAIGANYVAQWDPGTGAWAPLAGPGGEGVSGAVFDILVRDGVIILGGQFSYVNIGNPIYSSGVTRWSPTAGWTPLEVGLYGILALAADGQNLYAGGFFETVFDDTGASIPSPGIARWSFAESRWYPMDGGVFQEFQQLAQVRALHLDDEHLYVGGSFRRSSGTVPVAAPNLLAWDLELGRWGNVDGVAESGTSGPVYTLTKGPEQVVVAGGIGAVGGPDEWTTASQVALWNPTARQWSAIGHSSGQGISPFRLYSVTSLDGAVYAGGRFFRAGQLAANSLAAWDGQTWSLVGTPQNNGALEIHRIHGFEGKLYAAGFFGSGSGPGLQPGPALTSWDPVYGSWAYLGSFSDVEYDYGIVLAVLGHGDYVYVSGDFDAVETAAGSIPANNIARWNRITGEWSSLGTGVGDSESSRVSVLHARGDNLYVGGLFYEVNPGDQSIPARSVARWDGSQWHALSTPMGEGANGYVTAFSSDENHLYVGGTFVSVGGDQQLPAERVARWNLDGSGWESVGGGVGVPYDGFRDGVYALSIVDDVLYAGGTFRAIEQNTLDVRYFARWNLAGGPWSGVGSGVEGIGPSVFGLTAPSPGQLYVAGQFLRAGQKSSVLIGQYETRGTLDIQLSGSGTGRVTSSVGDMACSDSCSNQFAWDQTITLIAQPHSASVFLGWSGACSGTGACTLQFDRDSVVGAQFESRSDLFASDFE